MASRDGIGLSSSGGERGDERKQRRRRAKPLSVHAIRRELLVVGLLKATIARNYRQKIDSMDGASLKYGFAVVWIAADADLYRPVSSARSLLSKVDKRRPPTPRGLSRDKSHLDTIKTVIEDTLYPRQVINRDRFNFTRDQLHEGRNASLRIEALIGRLLKQLARIRACCAATLQSRRIRSPPAHLPPASAAMRSFTRRDASSASAMLRRVIRLRSAYRPSDLPARTLA